MEQPCNANLLESIKYCATARLPTNWSNSISHLKCCVARIVYAKGTLCWALQVLCCNKAVY